MKSHWVTILTLALWHTVLGFALAHPHYVSIGTATWIPENQSVEIALKFSAEDLEEVLIKQTKRDLLLDGKSSAAESALKAYVLANLSVTRPDDSKLPGKWIGYEAEDADAWIYVEFSIGKASLKGHQLTNTILIESFEQQVNLVNVTHGKRRKTLKFRKRSPSLKLPRW